MELHSKVFKEREANMQFQHTVIHSTGLKDRVKPRRRVLLGTECRPGSELGKQRRKKILK